MRLNKRGSLAMTRASVEAARATGCLPVLVRTGKGAWLDPPAGVPIYRDLLDFAEKIEELERASMIDFREQIDEHIRVIERIRPLLPTLEELARATSACLASGGKVLWMGNGGSAADSQHLAAELVGRCTRERRGLPAIALTTDSSALTAIGNDYGFHSVFARQVEALCCAGDIVVGISTSGNSANVLKAIEVANRLEATTAAFSGGTGGRLCELADHSLVVPSDETPRIQEAHIVMGHLLCDWVEVHVAGESRNV